MWTDCYCYNSKTYRDTMRCNVGRMGETRKTYRIFVGKQLKRRQFGKQ